MMKTANLEFLYIINIYMYMVYYMLVDVVLFSFSLIHKINM